MKWLPTVSSCNRRTWGIAAVLLCLAGPAWAGGAAVSVVDEAGAPVRDAVVSLASPDQALNTGPDAKSAAVMVQQNKMFKPHVLPIRVGTTVKFPNRDDFRHQIYSFSKPKPFEISLYSGDEDKRETFDKPGVVALGCNIHDGMIGYIYVLATDHYAATGSDGTARVGGLKPGKYTMTVWHPRQRGGEVTQEMAIAEGGDATAQIRLSLRPAPAGAAP